MDPTTYRFLSGAAGGSAPPVQITFTASSSYLSGNTATTLSWDVLNSLSVSIDQGVGVVAASGTTSQVANNTSRTYTLTAIGVDGITYTSSLTITWTNYCIYADWGFPEWC